MPDWKPRQMTSGAVHIKEVWDYATNLGLVHGTDENNANLADILSVLLTTEGFIRRLRIGNIRRI